MAENTLRYVQSALVNSSVDHDINMAIFLMDSTLQLINTVFHYFSSKIVLIMLAVFII